MSSDVTDSAVSDTEASSVSLDSLDGGSGRRTRAPCPVVDRRQYACSDIFVSFRIKTGNSYISNDSRHACNVKNNWTCVNSSVSLQLSVNIFIYIISVNLHAFFLFRSIYRVCY